MAITYPLTLPTHTGLMNVNLRAVNTVAISTSPFTYKQQIHSHSGQRWEAEISLPPMRRANAEIWVSFLLSLKGPKGTFLLGDPICKTAQGNLGGTPLVNGADQTGDTLAIDGCSASVTDWVKAGDYIQLGSGSSSTLHKVLQDADSNSTGEVSLDIWPSIRTAPADDAAVTTSNAVGLFRLASGIQDWSVNNIEVYGITFACVEAI